MKFTDEPKIRKGVGSVLKGSVLKGIELSIILLFVIFSNTNNQINDIPLIIIIITIGVISLWSIKSLLKRIENLEEKNNELNIKYEQDIKKILEFIDKERHLHDHYLTEYITMDYIYEKDIFYYLSPNFEKVFNCQIVKNNGVEWFKNIIAEVNEKEGCKLVDGWIKGDFIPGEFGELWMNRCEGDNLYVRIFAIPKYNIEDELIGFKIFIRDKTVELLQEQTIEAHTSVIKQSLIDGVRRNIIRDKIEKEIERINKCSEKQKS